MHITYHLRVLHQRFQSRISDENLIKNLEETHLTINMDNSCTSNYWSDIYVQYVNVVARGDAITMVVHIFEGCRSNIEALMIIFTDNNSNYPIRKLDDFVPKVPYYIDPKAWMDQSLFLQYFMEP